MDETRVVEIIQTLVAVWILAANPFDQYFDGKQDLHYIDFIMQKAQAKLVILFETIEIGSLYKANMLLNSF